MTLALAVNKNFRMFPLSQGIPTLLIIEAKTGEVITNSGRVCVSTDPEGKVRGRERHTHMYMTPVSYPNNLYMLRQIKARGRFVNIGFNFSP